MFPMATVPKLDVPVSVEVTANSGPEASRATRNATPLNSLIVLISSDLLNQFAKSTAENRGKCLISWVKKINFGLITIYANESP